MPAWGWVASGVGAWALILIILFTLLKRERKRLAAALEELGLVVPQLRPLRAGGVIGGVRIDLEHINWGPHGGGRYLTRIRATGRSTLEKVVAITPGWEWPGRAPTFGMRRIGSGEPLFDGTFELYVEGEEAGRAWRGGLAREVVAVGKPGKLGSVREIAVGGNGVSICLSGVGVPIDSARRAVALATRLAGGSAAPPSGPTAPR